MPLDWRQGSVVQASDVELVLRASVDHCPAPGIDGSADRLMTLTQDCDLVHDRFEFEPWAELVLLRPLGPYDKNRDNPCLFGKNPRRLVFQIEGEAPTEWWCLDPHSRFRIPRQTLLGLVADPSRSLPVDTTQALARWISRRYTRAAMANSFNDRLKCRSSEMGDLWKSTDAEAVSGVYLLGAREERPEDQDYQITVFLAIATGSVGDPILLERAHRVGRTLDVILSSCPGIAVDDVIVRPERDITLGDLRNYQRFDLDYRSGTDRQNASFPVDGVD